MKKILRGIIAGIVIVLAIFLIGILGKWESHYEVIAHIESVENGIAVITDDSGNSWTYESDEFENGESVILTLHNAGTSLIQDDAITEIKEFEE